MSARSKRGPLRQNWLAVQMPRGALAHRISAGPHRISRQWQRVVLPPLVVRVMPRTVRQSRRVATVPHAMPWAPRWAAGIARRERSLPRDTQRRWATPPRHPGVRPRRWTARITKMPQLVAVIAPRSRCSATGHVPQPIRTLPSVAERRGQAERSPQRLVLRQRELRVRRRAVIRIRSHSWSAGWMRQGMPVRG